MFENVDGRTDAGVTGILIAHLGAFGSGELKSQQTTESEKLPSMQRVHFSLDHTIPYLLKRTAS